MGVGQSGAGTQKLESLSVVCQVSTLCVVRHGHPSTEQGRVDSNGNSVAVSRYIYVRHPGERSTSLSGDLNFFRQQTGITMETLVALWEANKFATDPVKKGRRCRCSTAWYRAGRASRGAALTLTRWLAAAARGSRSGPPGSALREEVPTLRTLNVRIPYHTQVSPA